jgi:hypothetical protein
VAGPAVISHASPVRCCAADDGCDNSGAPSAPEFSDSAVRWTVDWERKSRSTTASRWSGCSYAPGSVTDFSSRIDHAAVGLVGGLNGAVGHWR